VASKQGRLEQDQDEELRDFASQFDAARQVNLSLLAILPLNLFWALSDSLAGGLGVHKFFFYGLVLGSLSWLGSRAVAAFSSGYGAKEGLGLALRNLGLPLGIAGLIWAFFRGYIFLCSVLPIGFGRVGRQINGMFALAIYTGIWVLGAFVFRALLNRRRRR